MLSVSDAVRALRHRVGQAESSGGQLADYDQTEKAGEGGMLLCRLHCLSVTQ